MTDADEIKKLKDPSWVFFLYLYTDRITSKNINNDTTNKGHKLN